MTEEHTTGSRKQITAQTWLMERVRMMPDLLEEAPHWVTTIFDHAWAPMTALSNEINHLPSAVWPMLMSFPCGYVYITTDESEYLPGPGTVRYQRVQNVARVSVEDLADENERPLHVIGHLIDHHLGCGGQPEGLWLSEGGGITPQWAQVGAQLAQLYALGYAPDDVAQSGVRDYFAQSLALYCRDRSSLNVADPQIEKWLHNTLWNREFWKSAQGEGE
jgi:hypothetical protein